MIQRTIMGSPSRNVQSEDRLNLPQPTAVHPPTLHCSGKSGMRPFDRPESCRIAVKVINHIEVMKVFRV